MLMKRVFLAILIVAVFNLSSCGGGDGGNGGPNAGLPGAANVRFTIVNATQETLYVYNFPDDGSGTKASPIPLAPSSKLQLPLLSSPQMRIYFSDQHLSNTIEKGSPPDVFNYSADATATYSFVEYYYEPSSSRYTIDLSYIDEFSYPITLTFSNVPSTYNGCVPGFEYGFTSLTAVKNALKSQTDYPWDALIWPAVVETDWNNGEYPQNMDRIIGPDKVWPNTGGHWVPHSYNAFTDKLPQDGRQLFSNITTNFSGWKILKETDNPSPSNTGYVKALHSAAKPDKNGKYGFFSYPTDNGTAEFTYVPDSTTCTITIYPHDK
ncbi:MAG TPA: beta-1,3-glucanase family protein [Geobacteraceae bacterium]